MWIDLLVQLIIFIVIVAVVILVAKWLATQVKAPEPVTKVVLWVLGALALVVFLIRFVKPLAS